MNPKRYKKLQDIDYEKHYVFALSKVVKTL